MNLAKRITTSIGIFAFVCAMAALIYEIVQSVNYVNWKQEFDGEGWLDIVTIPSSNPRLMWEYKPYGSKDYIKINRFGFRDRDSITLEKPPAVRRIAFIGDSITFGLKADYEDVFVVQFEERSNALVPPVPVQALNFGVDGYNIEQIDELLRTKVFKFSPDTVIYVLSMNDVDLSDASGEKIKYFKKPPSFFLQKAERALKTLSGLEYHQYYFRKNRTLLFNRILQMKQNAETRGADFGVVIVPVFFAGLESFDDYPLQQIHTSISEFLREHEIPTIDTLPDFSVHEGVPASFAEDIWHPNAIGHGVITSALIKGLVPSVTKSDDF